jgi:hypothetical protein
MGLAGVMPPHLRRQPKNQSVAFSSGGRLSTALAHSVAALKGEKRLTNGGESVFLPLTLLRQAERSVNTWRLCAGDRSQRCRFPVIGSAKMMIHERIP